MEVTDTKDAWESFDNGIRAQFSDDEVALTAEKHVEHGVYATFTREQFDGLINAVEHDSDLSIDGLRLEESESGNTRLCFAFGSGSHIVTFAADDLYDIFDVWNPQTPYDTEERDFVTYLREQDYLLGVTDVDEHASNDGKAKLSHHSCLTNAEMRCLDADENVRLSHVDFDDKYVRVVDDR